MPTIITGVTFGVLAQTGLIPRGTRAFVFERIFEVFLLLGTAVGVVVVGYMLYNAYKYRAGGGRGSDADRPVLGELPSGSGGGRKLFTSFFLSTVVVISLVSWTYGTLLFVEEGPEAEDTMEVRVEGYQFGWRFVYPNGHESDTLRVPRNESVRLVVTSDDVFHNFGIPALRVKTDAIPGQETDTWFRAEETGNYTAQCYELCGSGHSFMTATVVVMEPDEYESWYESTEAGGTENGSTTGETTAESDPGGALAEVAR
ncbi:cytochrome c oxidase subunit II [Halogeometricum sp. S1BR25-6]|uniref:Cytochrome c oxidase subunit II n=1 Tax=Halogeometricum salsisoli TaxID=2950536 RepID=A0ABU2GDS7_9EURY|nr:cytochrome c oxidase subunit II [Halogeometricum sp. S1BR25-6]MDS0298966.1 cytochrome c oxidase subunit II [Halogeometricum sp. S1BR25-6]